MASDEFIFFQLTYVLFAYCVVYPPQEFINVGLSVEKMCASFLKFPPEPIQFVQYHIHRTRSNRMVHSILPLLYMGLYEFYFGHLSIEKHWLVDIAWSIVWWMSLAAPLALAARSLYEWRTDSHQLMQEMTKYCGQGQSWNDVATSIDMEYRSIAKTISKISTISTVIATENWVIKTSLYSVRIAHQSDTALVLVKSDTHRINPDSSETIQFVNIVVKPTRPKVREFKIRLNAVDFTDLQDRLHRPITILNGVDFKRSVLEHFIEAFKELVALNGTYDTDQEMDTCFACMLAVPDIKLQKRCADVDAYGAPLPADQCCGNCFCRPMWCVECMAKWFASKQSEHDKAVWLEQKCPCPMCRTTFCMLDVCRLNRV